MKGFSLFFSSSCYQTQLKLTKHNFKNPFHKPRNFAGFILFLGT